jgi:ABC-type transporter Mla subunit MlaD
MESREQTGRLRVGIFLALGLAAVAGMVVYFGRFGEGIRKHYEIRVEYPNASGLLQGASVLLAGAKVGNVNTPPAILPDMQGVFVVLKIYEEVRIPSASVFTIGSSGLLGDRFVQILTTREALQSPPIEPGATVQGRGESGGFGELADGAGALMADIREAVTNINAVAKKVDAEVLNEATLEEMRATIENLQRTSAAFAEASGRIESVLDKAEAAVATGDEALASAKSAADEFRRTATDARALLAQARQGRGVLGALLSDREMAENLRALTANLRRHGVLFYKDSTNAAPPRGSR